MGKLIGRFGFLLSSLLIGLSADAQRVSDVTVIQDGQELRIQYLLSTTAPVDINLYVSENNGATWQQIGDFLGGSYGKGISSGRKEITWDVLQSRESFVGNSFVFKVMVANLIESVKIGNQVWMAKNLNVDHYRNGDPILTGFSNSQWESATEGAYAVYNDDPANEEIYGKLYNWFAVNDRRGLCPSGWHVASDEDWMEMVDLLGGIEDAGGKLKGLRHWDSPNYYATDNVKFSGLPGGTKDFYGFYRAIGRYGYWWSSTSSDNKHAFYFGLSQSKRSILRNNYYDKQNGFSVRCIKD